MSDVHEVTYRPPYNRTRWVMVGLGTAGAIVAAARTAYWGTFLDVWVYMGLAFALVGVMCLHGATARVTADGHGLHSWTLLHRLDVQWGEVAEVSLDVRHGAHVSVALRDGHTRRLPLYPPLSLSTTGQQDFDKKLNALRALHRRHGGPTSSHVAVISPRTAWQSVAGPLGLCVLLLAGAALAAWFVPITDANYRAWQAATPCTARTPASELGECRSTQRAVVARTEEAHGKGTSWLYFTDNRPLDRIGISPQAAEKFRPGDRVELTIWQHEVRVVTGKHYVFHDHFPASGDAADVAAVAVLLAWLPAFLMVQRLRGRRRGLRDDRHLPSTRPFMSALVVTALWLLPLCHFHPTTLTSSVAIWWGAAGLSVTLALLIRAWRATRIPTPGEHTGNRTISATAHPR